MASCRDRTTESDEAVCVGSDAYVASDGAGRETTTTLSALRAWRPPAWRTKPRADASRTEGDRWTRRSVGRRDRCLVSTNFPILCVHHFTPNVVNSGLSGLLRPGPRPQQTTSFLNRLLFQKKFSTGYSKVLVLIVLIHQQNYVN